MNNLKDYILEKFKINSKNATLPVYNYKPKDRKELFNLIHHKLIDERGEYADLNDIDVSEITDMHSLFLNSKFNGDISKWNVSKVENMESMFRNAKFNGDLSKWDVSNVKTMKMMFDGSKFTGENGNISNWKINSLKDMEDMFFHCPLEKNPPKWYK